MTFTLPVLVAVAPRTSALHPVPARWDLMPVMLPVVTPLVALKAVPCSVQGKPLLVTVNTRPNGPVQPLNVSVLIEPRLAPLIPWPLFSVPVDFELLQVTATPVLVSVSVVFPAVPV